GDSGSRQEQSSEILHGGSFSIKMTECFASLLSSSRIVTYDEKIFWKKSAGNRGEGDSTLLWFENSGSGGTMDRRTFVTRTAIGSAVLFLSGMAAAAIDDEVKLPLPPPIEVREAPLERRSPLGMPGLYPGRVVELSDPRSIVGNRVSQPVVRQMLEQGM